MEDIFEPRIIYPTSHTIQTLTDERKSLAKPDMNSSRMGNESIHVRNILLPKEETTVNNDLPQIETIDLSPISTEPQQIPQNDISSIISSSVMSSRYETPHVCYIYEILVDKPRKAKLKRKKFSGIHVRIRNSTKSKR